MGFTTKKWDTAGKPLIFQTEKDLQDKIDQYFESCEKHVSIIKKKYIKTVNGEPTEAEEIIEENKPLIPTIAGLAQFIGIDRTSLYNYSDREKYFDTVKNARDKILAYMENGLMNSTDPSAGKIFLAKNYGYTDRTETEMTISTDEETKKKLSDVFNDNRTNS